MATSRRIVTRVPALQNSCTPTTGPSLRGGSVPLRSFLIENPITGDGPSILARQRAQQKSLFFDFIKEALALPQNVSVSGFQCAYGAAAGDQLVLLCDQGGSFCVPVSILLENTSVARLIVKEKIEKFRQSFA
jgi:hypothetical protein